ncbi:MAG TPA: lytic murein transglycosylase [Bradyrhizobium sp.]|nr:lytic murein transglycosylase [Bradyrhizobium sp.]
MMKADAIRSAAKDFPKCIDGLRTVAEARGISRQTFDAVADGLKPDLQLLDHLDAQPEFRMAVWQYLDVFLSSDRIDRGREMLTRYRPALDAIEKAFGVDRHVLLAIWGIETNYGTEMGQWPVLTSTATLACIGRRQSYFRGEFVAALSILERGDIGRDHFVGSWSGAFGQTQFMPSSFEAFAVDFDRTGRLDIVGSVPNALASTANYLKVYGWTQGPASMEVVLPKSFDYSLSDQVEPRAAGDWAALGVVGADGRPIASASDASWLFVPAGAHGPSFLIFPNFKSILSYNPSYAYVLAVMLLSDRLRGGGELRHDWPRSERMLSDAERLELQARLVRRGFEIGGTPDGHVGVGTRQAIRRFQASVGMIADGYPSPALYERLVAP